MGIFDFNDEKEPVAGRAVKQAAKSAVQSVASGVTGQVKAGASDFFSQLLGDLGPAKTDTTQQQNQSAGVVGNSGNLSNPGEQGTEQADDQAAQLMKQQTMQQSAPQATTQQGQATQQQQDGNSSLSPEERRKLEELRNRLHKENYWSEFGDTETLMKKSEQQQKQEAAQKQQEEEEKKKEKKQEKKQEEQQRQVEENQNLKREKAPAGAG